MLDSDVIDGVKFYVVSDNSPAGDFEVRIDNKGMGGRNVRIKLSNGEVLGYHLFSNQYLCIEVNGILVPIAKGGWSETSFPRPLSVEEC